MTTPTTMTTSMITTATTMMTDVVVAPSLGGLLVGCVLLLTKTVAVVVIVEGEAIPEEVDAAERKHKTCHYGRIHENVMLISTSLDSWCHATQISKLANHCQKFE